MKHEDQTAWTQEPLVAEDGVPITAAVESRPNSPREGHSPTEAFSRALKRAVDEGSPSHGRPEPGWASIPGVADHTAGHLPPGNSPSTGPSTTKQRSAGSASELNVAAPDFGVLMAPDSGVHHEPQPAEDKPPQIEHAPIEPGSITGAGHGTPVEGLGSRPVRVEIPSSGAQSQGPTMVPEGSRGQSRTGSEGLIAGHPGPVGLTTLIASIASGGDGGGSSGAPRQGTSSAISDRPIDAVGLPGVNPVADQLAFAPGTPESAESASGASPYSVNIHESSIASSAFGPVLAGNVGSGHGGGSDLPTAGGAEGGGHSSQDTWSGLSTQEGTDQANGSALDLSKTNDLLQQLLDEFRKGRQPFLPINDRNSSL